MAASIVVATGARAQPAGLRGAHHGARLRDRVGDDLPGVDDGRFMKRINNKGAIAGMLTGLIFTVVCIFLHKG